MFYVYCIYSTYIRSTLLMYMYVHILYSNNYYCIYIYVLCIMFEQIVIQLLLETYMKPNVVT